MAILRNMILVFALLAQPFLSATAGAQVLRLATGLNTTDLRMTTGGGTRPTSRPRVPRPVRGATASAVPADYDGDGRFDVAVRQDDGRRPTA